MWVINIQHWLDETMSGPAVPQLKIKVKNLSYNLLTMSFKMESERLTIGPYQLEDGKEYYNLIRTNQDHLKDRSYVSQTPYFLLY